MDTAFHEFCLACDKQTTEGAYCSQACRAADILQAESHRAHSAGPSSPTTALSSWSFPQTTNSNPFSPHSHTHHNSNQQYHFEEPNTLNSKRSSLFSLDGPSYDGPAGEFRGSTSSSSVSSPSSPPSETQHFPSHVRQALKSYEDLFVQKSRRKQSSAS